MPVRWRYGTGGAALLAAILVVVTQLGSTSATEDGAMAVDCNAGVTGVQSQCAYPSGAEFSVEVNIAAAPSAGYYGFQAKVWWDPANVRYEATTQPRDEALSPHCTVPARTDNSVVGEPSVLFGCITLPLPDAGYRTTGAALRFRFQCLQDSYTELELVPQAGDNQLGTHFLDNTLAPVDPTLTKGTVVCGNPPTPTPCGPEGCPTRTPRAGPHTPFPTPTPVPPVDMTLEAGCSPDTMRPHEVAVLTCTASIANRDDRVVSGAQLELGLGGADGLVPVIFYTVALTVDGQPVNVDRYYQSEFGLRDLEPGETVEARFRFIVEGRWGEGHYGEPLTLVYNGQVVGSALLDFTAAADAPFPPTGLVIGHTLLTDYHPVSEEVPPPATAEYELFLTNQTDAAAEIVLVDRYSDEIAPSGTDPPVTSADDSSHRVSWDLGTLAPGERRQVRITFASLDECSFVRHDVLVTARFGDVVEEHATQIGDFFDFDEVVIGTNWDCLPQFVDDGDSGPPGVEPAPTATATVGAPGSGENVATPQALGPAEDAGDGGATVLAGSAGEAGSPDEQSESQAPTGQQTSHSEAAARTIGLPSTGAGPGQARQPDWRWAALAVAGESALVAGLYLRRRRSSTP